MDVRYLEHIQPGSPFYDNSTKHQGERLFDLLVHPPADWEKREADPWTVLRPPGVVLPPQGWKIHVSATQENAERILEAVANYCFSLAVGFKFLCGPAALLKQNRKYAHRGSSGKFITIYPTDEDVLQQTLQELGGLLDGEQGPYILSDLRWRNGPLYVRYGGFARRYTHDSAGQAVLAIENPDGDLVPDCRDATFAPPPWVELPPFLREQQAGTRCADPFPYRVEAALHFSNGGGVYRAVELATERTVALKEARPHAGLDTRGIEAVTRLQHESTVLQRLSGLSCVPQHLAYLTYWDHHFLTSEFIEGTTLWNEMVVRTPLLAHGEPHQKTEQYTGWALDVLDQVERGLADIHARGVVVGDIHPNNIMVRPDGRIVFIDFEFAGVDDPDCRPPQGAPGFYPPPGITGTAVDEWLTACLSLHLFYPLTPLLGLSRAKALQLAEAIEERFPVSKEFIERLKGKLGQHMHDASGYLAWGRDVSRSARSIAEGVLASASPDRDDRLFPGDIEQFSSGGLNVAYGAAGVLYALTQTGHGRFDHHEQWLIEQVHGAAEPHLGFYDGLHGIAYVLDQLGHQNEAIRLLERGLPQSIQQHGIDLHGGLSGIGLNLLHFSQRTGESSLRDRALAIGEQLSTLLPSSRTADAANPVGTAGLMRGWSGPALFFLRLHEETGDGGFLDLAARALRRDLAGCVQTANDTLEVDEGFRVLPYLATGSAGIGLVLQDYLAHQDDEELRVALAGIIKAAQYEFYLQPNLFNGVAGMLLLLSRERARTTTSALDGSIDRLMRLLTLTAIPFQGHIAFPGEQLLRLSMDLATGSAGVLLGITAARTGQPALPFLPPPVSTQTPANPPEEPITHSTKELMHHDHPRPAKPLGR